MKPKRVMRSIGQMIRAVLGPELKFNAISRPAAPPLTSVIRAYTTRRYDNGFAISGDAGELSVDEAVSLLVATQYAVGFEKSGNR